MEQKNVGTSRGFNLGDIGLAVVGGIPCLLGREWPWEARTIDGTRAENASEPSDANITERSAFRPAQVFQVRLKEPTFRHGF
jgi:hypothetical protein